MSLSYTNEKSSNIIGNGVFYGGMFFLVWLSGVYNWQGWLAYLDIGLAFVPLFILARQSDSKTAPLFILAAGLFKDILSGTPFGFWGLLFITFYILTHAMQRLFVTQGYGEQWLRFSVNVAIIYSLAFAIAIGRADIIAAPLANILSVVATIMLYPLIALLFSLTPSMMSDE